MTPEITRREPLPGGARDVLPHEAHATRDAEDLLRAVLVDAGHGEIRTPVLEFASAIERAADDGLDDAYRLFDPDGRVLVLRPDLTIPAARLIATRLADTGAPTRVWYTGAAFRVPRPGAPGLSEHHQIGAEIVGVDRPDGDVEMVDLLARCLHAVGLSGARIAIGDVSIMNAVLTALVPNTDVHDAMRAAAVARDHVGWAELSRRHAKPEDQEVLEGLIRAQGVESLGAIVRAVPSTQAACTALENLVERLTERGVGEMLSVDLGIVHGRTYYDGIVVEAYAPGVGAPVARGGRYDGLIGHFGNPRPAVGFGIELEAVHRARAYAENLTSDGAQTPAPLRICVPLGALYPGARDLLSRSGIDITALENAGRRLSLEGEDGTLFITTRPSDVPTYVESGAADIGIVGRDVLLERGSDVYELMDLRFGGCRMSYCTSVGEDPTPAALDRFGVVRIATKYPRSAERHFAATGRQVEIVKVNGSVELAALVGVSHGIVDLVATGRTLRENGLVEREVIFESSARLIANRAAYTVRAEEIEKIAARMAVVAEAGVNE